MKRTVVLASLLVLCALFTSGCRRGGGGASLVESRDFAVAGAPRVTVVNFNGDIEVVAGESGVVKTEVRKQSASPNAGAVQTDLDRIKVDATQEGDTVSLVVSYRQPRNGRVEGEHASASVRLTVPPGTVLDLVTGEGNVSVPEGMGNTGVMAAKGDVTFRLPASAAFRLAGVLGEGTIKSDFSSVRSGPTRGPLAAAVGIQPTTAITVTLGAGTLTLRKGR